MNLATLSGRIPILPEAVWARGCAVDRCVGWESAGWWQAARAVEGERQRANVLRSEICTEHSLRHFGDRNQHEEELGASASSRLRARVRSSATGD